ncbi:MAG: hypothetical protein GXY32_01440 [Ruminococcaceae bacterium]|nr:hypothetical protein [Oscillospiraceae bacterium]
MPRELYSDKYIKHKRGAEKDEDNMLHQKAMAEELDSEQKEEARWLKQDLDRREKEIER